MSSCDKRFKLGHLWYWMIGPLALLWVLLRSGMNPKRLTYPCQRAAIPLAAQWLLAAAGFFAGSLLLRKFAKFSAVAIAIAGVVWFIGITPDSSRSAPTIPTNLPVWHIENPTSKVFLMDNLPATTGSLAAGDASVPDAHLSDPAIDTLLELMAEGDVYLHQTTGQPDGIVGSDDIVIIKGNFQWTSVNTTNTDRIKGLIWQILNHPDGFTGEIIVADNIQNFGVQVGADDNNSEDPDQSIDEVVNTFNAKGYPVYLMSWASFWSVVVLEYANGNYNDGYTYDSETHVTYPKFQSPSGQHYISLRYGIWDDVAETYDHSRLCIIDFPVLKSHMRGGSTIAIKNWVGMLTTAYYNQRYGGIDPLHDYYFFDEPALVARVMAVTFPQLTILDAAWTTGDGPIDLVNIYNTNMVLASTDPAAVSWYGAKFILTPVAVNPTDTDPDLEGGLYAGILERWTTFLSDSAGYACTNDSAEIAVYDRRIICECEEPCDDDGDFWKDLCDNCPNTYNPLQEDVDGDGIGDSCEIIRAWHVQADGTGDAPTIQAAIDSCTHGDTVVVADGIHAGEGNVDLDLRGRRILLKSQHGPRYAVIDCQGSDSEPRRAFTFPEDVDSSVVIDGLTIRGGYGPDISSSSGGGAIFFDHSSPMVKNCVFTGNSAQLGGAVYVNGASPHLINCTFAGNSADYGAAVFLYSNASITLDNCILAFNQNGLVFYCLGSSTAALSCCDVYGNAGGDWVECITGLEGVDGNFSADPLFCNVGIGDVGLANETSPCLPANNDCGVLVGALDEGCTCNCGAAWGDVSGDGNINPVDVTFMVQYVYLGNDMRVQPYNCPSQAGDVNCDGNVNPIDMVHFVNYVYLSITPFPCENPCSL